MSLIRWTVSPYLGGWALGAHRGNDHVEGIAPASGLKTEYFVGYRLCRLCGWLSEDYSPWCEACGAEPEQDE
ncbi:MAG: hypothetical protein QW057_01005 [Candidatus Bathyarchaeia archaeon]